MSARRVYLQLATHELVNQLRARYPRPAYELFEQVGNSTGFSASRHADAVVMSTWPSRGLELMGFEVKISRGDWRRELKSPEKAEVIASHCDRWFLVVANESIVAEGELPAAWGLLVSDGKKLVCKREAPAMKPKPLSREFLAAILRRAGEVQDVLENAAFERGREKGIADGPEEHARRMKFLEDEKNRLEQRIKEFEAASGVKIETWDAGRIGEAVKLVMSEYFRAPHMLSNLRDGAQKIVDLIGRELEIAERLAGIDGENGRAKLREAARR